MTAEERASGEATGRRDRLTLNQRQMLSDIEATGDPAGGYGWTSHSQRTLDSLVRRGLVAYRDGWHVVSQHAPAAEVNHDH